MSGDSEGVLRKMYVERERKEITIFLKPHRRWWMTTYFSQEKKFPARDIASQSRFKPFELYSFFFTSLPEHLRTKKLSYIFREYGKVKEVVILVSKDNKGRMLDFAWFLHVKNVK